MRAFRDRMRALASGSDAHFTQVLTGAAVAFALKAIGAGLAFALNVVIGRTLGVEGAGLYFLALSLVTIISVVTRFGLDNSLLRFIASAVAVEDWARAKGVYRLGMATVTLASLLAGAAVSLGSQTIADSIVGQPQLGPVLQVMGLATLGMALMFLVAECLKGIKRIGGAVTVSSILYPLIAIVLVVPLSERFGPAGAASAYAIGVSLAAFSGLAIWYGYTRGVVHGRPTFAFSELWESCRPLWAMSIITKAIMPWLPLLLLGFFASAEDAGIFGAATRVAMLITFLLIAVNTAISANFAELHAKGELQALARLARRFALITTLVTSPILLVLIFASDFVMGIFGADFARGGIALKILALGHAINALTGSAGQLLMMTGHEREVRNASIVAGIMVAALSLLLIPPYGFIGAAIATSVSVALMNLISIALIKKRLGIFVMPWARD